MIATMFIWWALVTSDCTGTPEPGVRYEVRYNVARRLGEQLCDPTDPSAGMCPIYTPFAWRGPTGRFEPPFDTGELDLGPGEVLVYEVTAIDAAGNRDCGVTP